MLCRCQKLLSACGDMQGSLVGHQEGNLVHLKEDSLVDHKEVKGNMVSAVVQLFLLPLNLKFQKPVAVHTSTLVTFMMHLAAWNYLCVNDVDHVVQVVVVVVVLGTKPLSRVC